MAETGGDVYTIQGSGDITPHQCAEHVRAIVRCARVSGYRRFLLDLRATTYVGSVLSQYAMAYEQADAIGLSRTWKVALLVDATDQSRDFQEIVAQNAGYQLKQFYSYEAALAWLHQ